MRSRFTGLFCLLLLASTIAFAKDYSLLSPDKKIRLTVSSGSKLTWSVNRGQQMLLQPSHLALKLTDGRTAGINPVVVKASKRTVDGVITAVIPVRNKQIKDQYNELTLQLKGGFSVTFRAYNDGVAYRFESALGNKAIKVEAETVDLNFSEDCDIYLPKENDPELQSHYEADFERKKVSTIKSDQYGYLPLHVSVANGVKMVFTEADLYDYPNLFMYGTGSNSLISAFPKVILENKLKPNSDRTEVIVKKADYIADTKGTRTFPWRTLIISADDKGLLETELVYKLSSPNVLQNTAWIKPGKVAWDWWNANNIYGVNFQSGINTATYKYYIDFAADYGLEYIILDEGWTATTTNLLKPAQGLDVEELIKYGKSKNVGVILWCLWQPLDQHMDEVLDKFAEWGAAGIKVDFMARADQYMVNFYERTASATAKRQLLLDLHGAYKPVGLNRKYPNVLNYEGVRGLENNKWETTITPEHNTVLPFTRMVAGPMDYTPGAMLNATAKNFHITYTEPMSMGTRAHQGAMYVIYDAPLQMLADNPSNYKREPEFTRFIAQIPTTWDRTIGLAGEAGQYVVTARKKDNKWYIAAMTNWSARKLEIDLSFLDEKQYNVQTLQDGPNADKHAADYLLSKQTIQGEKHLSINLAPGGGWVAVLTPAESDQ